MSGKKPSESVRVVVRSRPFNPLEIEKGSQRVVEFDFGAGLVYLKNPQAGPKEPPKSFNFDFVYDWNSAQEQVYKDVAQPIVDSVMEGYNGTIFAYGQTGAGKTFTMDGKREPPELRGLIPNAFFDIFEKIAQSEDKQFLVRVSCLEIYNEEVRDLLGKDPKKGLDLKETPDRGVYVKDLTSVVVKSVAEMERVILMGKAHRTVGGTIMNPESSRSHSIFTITIETCETGLDGQQKIRAGKLNMVDLAGSERQNKTGATGDRLKEGCNINLSLSALGNVISALVDGKSTHIPYRDSKLTRLLQDSLGGNTKTVMVAACSPADYNYEETLSTLRYATRAKKIQNKPKINEDPKDALLRDLQEEITRLKAQLEKQGTTGEPGAETGVDNAQQEAYLLEIQQQMEEKKRRIQAEKDMAQEERARLEAELEKNRQEAERVREEKEREQKEKEELAKQLKAMEDSFLNSQSAQSLIEQELERARKESELAAAEREKLLKLQEEARKEIEAVRDATAKASAFMEPVGGDSGGSSSGTMQTQSSHPGQPGVPSHHAPTKKAARVVEPPPPPPPDTKTKEELEQAKKELEQQRALVLKQQKEREQLEKQAKLSAEEKAKLEREKKRQEDELRRIQEEMEARKEDELRLKRELQEREEQRLAAEEQYANLEEEIKEKRKKWSKLLDKYQAAQQEIADLQHEWQQEKEDLLETLRDLNRQLKLKSIVIENFIPSEELNKTEKRAQWNEESDEWRLVKTATAKEMRIKRPPSATGLKRPTSEYARLAIQMGDQNPRFKSENILILDLDMPERTTQDYMGMGASGHEVAAPGYSQQQQQEEHYSPYGNVVYASQYEMQQEAPARKARPQSGKRPGTATKRKKEVPVTESMSSLSILAHKAGETNGDDGYPTARGLVANSKRFV